MNAAERFLAIKQAINNGTANVAVMGLGYVGLPLAVAFAEAGHDVVGFDPDVDKCDGLNCGRSHVEDVPDARVAPIVESGRLRASSDPRILEAADAILICVPTPLNKTHEPDLSYVVQAIEDVVSYGRSGQLIVLESTTYPGTTQEALQPRLEAAGHHIGEDCWLAFSPERIDPGNEEYSVQNIPKVVGGTTSRCTALATALYERIVEQVMPVSSTKAAEMVKLLENTFRMVNIGLVNEFAQWCRRLDVDVWEVIAAAATKPFGFMPFYPGPGLGGHCIPVDPMYLSWKLRGLNDTARFIELAREINVGMPSYVVSRIVDALNEVGRALRGSTVLVLGVAYKANVSDVRESPALAIIELLTLRGANVKYADPHVADITVGELSYKAQPVSTELLANAECVVILADHDDFAWPLIAEKSKLIVDTRNRLSPDQCQAGRWHGL